jgi:UDPglucose 6-dehydrogenase
MENKAIDKKIGIIGVGMVGGALRRFFESSGIKPFLYDKYKELGSPEEVNESEIIFVCVPTPFDKKKGFDISYVENAFDLIKSPKIVVIKSTVVPGTTEKFQKKYPFHKVLFNPEFLVEKDADRGMRNPDRQIVGFTKESYDFADDILNILPEAPFQKKVSATEAEMVKYFGNNFLAMKVIFANQVYNLCEKLKMDYDVIAECASRDERIGESHLDVNHGGYRGYGGKCLPKDIRAFIQFADANGVDLRLHKVIEELNDELMKMQNIDDPENFSIRE